MVGSVVIYGLISGAVIIATIIVSMGVSDTAEHGGETVGYLIMIVGLSLIFVGVKQIRDRQFGGIIPFWSALGLGLAMSVVAGVVYVVAWEAYLAATDYRFIEDYAAALLVAKKNDGLSGADLEAFRAEIDRAIERYGNPLFRLPITFMEIFPVGVLVSLVSAALLRNPGVLPARG